MSVPSIIPAEPASPRVGPERALGSPGFVQALRGIWLFTWKRELTWRRQALRIVLLLALPCLVYITTSSPQAWSRLHSPLGDPEMKLNELFFRLARAHLPLEAGQREQLRRIFAEEFAQAERIRSETESTGTAVAGQRELVKGCYARIGERARTILDERQFGQFQTFERRNVLMARPTDEPWANWTAPFYHWLVDFYFFVILPLNCVRLSGALIRDELQADTLGFLTTRPLSRARLVVVLYLAQTFWLEITMLLEALLLFAAGGLRHVPGLGSLLPLFLATQFLAVLAWSALGAFLGLLARRYIALALVYALIVELGIGRIPTNINTLSLMRHLKTLLAHDQVLRGLYDWAGKSTPVAVGVLLLASGVFLSLAAAWFTFKEYHHAAEMQK